MAQDTLMKFDPQTGQRCPYPSHTAQYRKYHEKAAWLVNPWSGHRRKATNVGTDPFGIDIKVVGEPTKDVGETSDGYHTFNELYEFRKMYNAALFNEWSLAEKYDVHKSTKHHDGEDCFGGGWFIVVAVLPEGQISNHYKIGDWDLFTIPDHEKALFEYDGHDGADVLHRLKSL